MVEFCILFMCLLLKLYRASLEHGGPAMYILVSLTPSIIYEVHNSYGCLNQSDVAHDCNPSIWEAEVGRLLSSWPA